MKTKVYVCLEIEGTMAEESGYAAVNAALDHGVLQEAISDYGPGLFVASAVALSFDPFERAAQEAETGGCGCARAPCEHDDMGKRIAATIRALGGA